MKPTAIDILHDSIKEDDSAKLKVLPFENKNFINFNELSDYGLIWKINKEVLHPLGLALARNEDGTSNGCIVAPDGAWEYDADADKRNLKKYDNFLNLLK